MEIDQQTVDRHRATVIEFSQPGGALDPASPHSTLANPAWYDSEYGFSADRRALHTRLISEYRSRYPDLKFEKKAMVMAGPPGAGKSSVRQDVIERPHDWIVVDADEFKSALLEEAVRDGSYETFIKPEQVREREEAGEKFFPLEHAALVHEESSRLARRMRDELIAEGANMVVDTVLSSPEAAQLLGEQLGRAGYSTEIVDVEVPIDVSLARITSRWEQDYSKALKTGSGLGGRWVPDGYVQSVFSAPDGTSWSEVSAEHLAAQPAVTRRRVFRAETVAPSQATLVIDESRLEPGAAMVESEVLLAVRVARTSHVAARAVRPTAGPLPTGAVRPTTGRLREEPGRSR